MPIVVNSPFSGRAVKVRDQDVGRAIRDEEGRIFYLVERADGSGYYAAPTRKGSEKDEQRYDAMANKAQTARDTFEQSSKAQIHDATGKRRPIPLMRMFVLLLMLLAAGALGYFFLVLDGDATRLPRPWETPPAQPTPPPANTRQAAPAPSYAVGPGPVAVSSSAALELQTFTPAGPDDVGDYRTSASGLQIRTDQPGRGQLATAGAYVRIRYEASLPNGPVLDSIWQGEPIGFVLWSGQAIRGWDEGIAGMAEGEIRSLIIPSHLITGSSTTQGSPSNQLPATTLHCRIQLVEVLPGVTIETDHQPGSAQGRIARPGDRVAITFVGQVQGHDTPFCSSEDLDGPLPFTLGQNQVIPGLELGVVGMAQGETRTLTIPPYLAYGQRGFGQVIPPQATLIYRVTLQSCAR